MTDFIATMTIENARDLMYTTTQQKVLFWVGKPTAFVGILSSAFIAACILRDREGFSTKVFRRLFLGLSLCHLLMILVWLLSTIPTPEGLFYGSQGSSTSCSAIGFLVHLAFVSTMVYNGAVGIYYYLVFSFNWSDATIKRRVEPFLHAMAVLYPLVGAIVGISTDMYGPDPIYLQCWVGPHQQHRNWFIWLSGLVEINVAILVKFATVGKICYEVYQLERKSQARLRESMKISGSMSLSASQTENTNSISQWTPTASTKKKPATRNSVAHETFVQVCFFLSSCLMPYGSSMVLKFVNMYWVNRLPQDGYAPTWLFVIAVIYQTMYPLQGFINVFIFVRPIYKKRQQKVQESKWECIRASLWLSLGIQVTTKSINRNKHRGKHNPNAAHSAATIPVRTTIASSTAPPGAATHPDTSSATHNDNRDPSNGLYHGNDDEDGVFQGEQGRRRRSMEEVGAGLPSIMLNALDEGDYSEDEECKGEQQEPSSDYTHREQQQNNEGILTRMFNVSECEDEDDSIKDGECNDEEQQEPSSDNTQRERRQEDGSTAVSATSRV